MSAYYNEGVGHGGFLATFATAGSIVVESLTKEKPSAHVINQGDQIGAPLKWAGVAGFETATAVVQLPTATAGGTTTVTEISPGDSFTAPSTHGGGSYVVTNASEAFQVGDYWKANLTLQKKLV